MKVELANWPWPFQSLLLLACVALGGCAEPPIGQGPIKFTPKMQAQYDQYRQSMTPGAFVVSNQGGTFYTYCSSMDCRSGATAMALQLCRRRDVGECFVYDIGGHVVWREDLPPSMSTAAVESGVETERGRNVLKVDCAAQLKATMPAAVRAGLATELGVKESRVPWTVCDRLVDGLASGRISTEDFLATQQGRTDPQALNRLLELGKADPPLAT